MKVAVYSTKPYDEHFLTQANQDGHPHELVFLEPRLNAATAALANGFDAVCVFVNDQVDAPVLAQLAEGGTRAVALRCAGFNNVDLKAAERLGIDVVRVPAYSPYAVAEHTVALILTLNRQIHRAYHRIRDGNFALDGLLGFDLRGRTVGIVGTGQIGMEVVRIMRGFGCQVLCNDPRQNPEVPALGGRYVSLDELFRQADIVTLHCPLTPETHHLIDAGAVARMKTGVMLINTSRGAIVDTAAIIEGLKSGQIGYLGLDVYEEEGDLFFEDLSNIVLKDDVFARLLTFPNVVITGHQGFFTRNALENIARTTLGNLTELEARRPCANCVTASG
ncbi:2-hydroxyacid dehydrogenase [Marinobacter daepoensis]|uniref:2-hydroxyacid dehydrogenase n=1 Tax=Marinobacter daepoensis TaxID=262077 RepID=A0ABS3BES3_9GAMM|nr:2-hydroxyacid dehydrogenase [Marinobacter daepoensis]MBN7770023.1 2-hydroxyacid dehydrogenase [Marinobacter daepoensis]MBY6080411.1 2-hydroxyacid dehydrogenase [Marinobacter daepoensis]